MISYYFSREDWGVRIWRLLVLAKRGRALFSERNGYHKTFGFKPPGWRMRIEWEKKQ